MLEQKQLLDEVRNAANKAAAVFKASCPSKNAFPLTPPGRLRAMTARLTVTLEMVADRPPGAKEVLRLALRRAEGALQPRLGRRSPLPVPKRARRRRRNAQSCKEPKPGLSNLPIEKIEDVVNPSDAQEADLNKLQEATDEAVSILQAACPEDTPLTPPGRLEAMEKRLQAMIDAANTVKPALDSFYASLTSEQKARFNRIGQELAQSGG